VSPSDAAAPDDAHNAQIGFDTQGNAVAIWARAAGSETHPRAAIYSPGTGWGEAVEVESSGDILEPMIAVAPDGTALAVWQQVDGTTGASMLWSSRLE
jgi:hypothetical protein